MLEFFRVNLYRRPFQVDEQRDVGEKPENVGEKLENVGDSVGEKPENVGDVGEKLEDVGDGVGEKPEDVGDVGEKPENVGDNEKTPLNDKDAKATVLKIIINNNKASAAEIAKEMLVTQRTVERYIKELREEGNLIRHGSARGGYWEVVK